MTGMLNCRQGDLVLVVSGYEPFIGKILTVTHLIAQYPAHWDTDPVVMDPFLNCPVAFSDSSLRPIRDQSGDDETLAWAGLPKYREDPVALKQLRKALGIPA